MGERNIWFDRFCKFLYTGPTRSLLGTYKAELVRLGKTPAKVPRAAPKTWRDACALWEWRERAEAWDAFQREKEQALSEDGRRKAALKLGLLAPDAVDVLEEVMRDRHLGQKRLAADSILDRTKQTATKGVHEFSEEAQLMLRQLGAIAIRFVRPEDRDAFVEAFKALEKEGEDK